MPSLIDSLETLRQLALAGACGTGCHDSTSKVEMCYRAILPVLAAIPPGPENIYGRDSPHGPVTASSYLVFAMQLGRPPLEEEVHLVRFLEGQMAAMRLVWTELRELRAAALEADVDSKSEEYGHSVQLPLRLQNAIAALIEKETTIGWRKPV